MIPKRDLISVLCPVLLLAFGLVCLIVIVIGYLMHWLIPALPLAAAFALAAVVSPTDAVAVNAITSRLKAPARVTTILNGESLINDASGLVAFKFAVVAAVTGTFRWSDGILQFFVLSGGGLALGLAIAWAIGHIRIGLKRYCIQDPTIQADRTIVEAGGLMSYAQHFVENYQRSATYVDRILKGARPGDLPVEQPTQFELVINLKTARALDLTISQSILQRADAVIE